MTDIVVADAHALLADLLRTVLTDHGFVVSGVATTEEEAAALVVAKRPSFCLVDHRSLGGERGLMVLHRLIGLGCPSTRFLVMTSETAESGMRAARAAGIAGYLHKSGGVENLLDALVRARAGEVVVRVPRRLPVARSDAAREAHRLAEALTVRERECLRMLVDGSTTSRMVEELGISVMTVRSHIRAVLCKLGVHSRLEAASMAVRYGLVETVRAHAG